MAILTKVSHPFLSEFFLSRLDIFVQEFPLVYWRVVFAVILGRIAQT